jgi:hypothetical protein
MSAFRKFNRSYAFTGSGYASISWAEYKTVNNLIIQPFWNADIQARTMAMRNAYSTHSEEFQIANALNQ